MAIGNLGLGLGGHRPHDPSAISSQCNVHSYDKGNARLGVDYQFFASRA